MEDTIYIDELIKKIIKRWKLILVLTAFVMAIMGIYGYHIVKEQGNEYVYRCVFVVKNPEYDDISDTMRLVNSVFRSNGVLKEVAKQQEISRDESEKIISNVTQIETNTSGTVILNMEVEKELAKEIDFTCFKTYYEIGTETLLEKFPDCDLTVIDEPYIQSEPMDYSGKKTVLIRTVVKYTIYGVFLGMIVSVFLVGIMILWNPKEYSGKEIK